MEKKIELNENERIDDLQYKGLKIIQNNDGFCFGIDSILLSDFAKNIKENSDVVDLGTGTGILGLLLCGKTKLRTITGIEIQEDVAKMAERSIKLNELENRFKIFNVNINSVFKENLLKKNKFDVVIMNPPYKELGSGITNENKSKLIARHEITATLEDFVKTAAALLKDKGELYIVHKPERTVDIITKLRENKLEPKELKVVYSRKDTDASLILIKAVKGRKEIFKNIKTNIHI